MKTRVVKYQNMYYVQNYTSNRGWKNIKGSQGTLLVYDNQEDAINTAKSLSQYNRAKVVWSSDEI